MSRNSWVGSLILLIGCAGGVVVLPHPSSAPFIPPDYAALIALQAQRIRAQDSYNHCLTLAAQAKAARLAEYGPNFEKLTTTLHDVEKAMKILGVNEDLSNMLAQEKQYSSEEDTNAPLRCRALLAS